MRPVAIVGLGCVCALGPAYPDCMQALYDGHRRFGPPTRFPAHCETSQPVFEVPERFLPNRSHPESLSRTCRMILMATDEALKHGPVDTRVMSQKRVGICLGSNIGVTTGYATNRTQTKDFLLPTDRFMATNPTHCVAERIDLCGPQQTVANACSAGSDAIGIAADWIDTGICDAVIAGGTDEITPRVYFGFKSLFINAEQPCRPFDRDRRGLNLGEGAAVFLLASMDFCRSQHLTPKGYVLGYGASADAHHFTQPRADGKGLNLAIDDALSSAGLEADDIDFINAHGTGTLDNDRVESRVIADRFPGRPFVSIKGATGHTLGAAGAIEAVITLGCLADGRLPTTAGYQTPDPDLPVHPVAQPTVVRGKVALSQNLAFGGSNSVLIIASAEWSP